MTSGSPDRSSSDEDPTDKTLQSDEFVSPSDASDNDNDNEDNQRTIVIPEGENAPLPDVGEQTITDAGEFAAESADSQTFISDDSFVSPPTLHSVAESADMDSSIESGPHSQSPTVSSDIPSDPDSNTLISGDDFELQDPGKTFQTDDRTQMSFPEGSEQTFISDDDVKLVISKTWGGGINSGTNPGMTIKSMTSAEPTAIAHGSIPARQLNQVSENGSGEYELMKVLGEGGMGIVWDARQRSVERNVAIKMIKPTIAAKAKQTEKFVAEAIVTGDLEHPNIVPIHELGQDQHGNFFYAMKHVQGTPWNKVIRVMELHENLDVLLRTCDAIAFAHARGIVHRDLKPENIMLGDFGEVLVMDWGLALPTEEFSKRDRISRAHGMGGTPAYMAPEMATGPISRVSYTSDVYLLGAILFEIVTGHPPHRGKTTQQCLAAAMRNMITPVEKKNELIDIALKAMHTDCGKRHQTVKQFQTAIRNYLAHEKSLEISRRATQELEQAHVTGDYTNFARSVFGYEEAIALWVDNDTASEGLRKARRQYAESALSKGDYDLAESMVDDTDPDHEELSLSIRAAKDERDSRQKRLRLARRAVTGLALAILVILGTSYYLINEEVKRAVTAEGIALEEKERADEQRLIAQEQRAEAEESRKEAQLNSEIAIAERARAEEREKEAQKQRKIALEEKEKAELARQAEQYESYVARIGLAAAKVDENAFSDARELLLQCPPELRNWEWGRLMYLCSQSSRQYRSEAPVDGLALNPDGSRFATASWDGRVRIWDRETGDVLRELVHSSIYVHAADWSKDGLLIVSGSADSDGNLKFWNAETGEKIAAINGHEDAVIGVTISADRRWLVSCSYDNTAKLWNIENPAQPELMTTLVGHNWWVWDSAFQSGFDPAAGRNRIVTVSQDGKAIVWEVAENARSARPSVEFLEHDGPVYTVAYHPTKERIATGGYDRKIHYWDPDVIQPFDFEAAVAGRRVPDQKYRTLSGHIGPVRCLEFSDQGDLLISGAQDNAVRVWKLDTGRSIKTFRGHDSAVRACQISPDGKFVYSGSEDQTAILWSVNDYAEIHTLAGQDLSGHADAILSAYFSPSGKEVVTASRDRSARIWDTRTGQEEQLLTEGHEFLSSSAVFLNDEQYLVTAAADNSVRIWNTSTGSEVRRLQATGRAALLAASDDSQWLATGSDQDGIQVWSVPQLLSSQEGPVKPVAVLQGHQHPVTAIRFLKDDPRLVSGDTHGRCVLWNVAEQQAIWSVRHHTMKITDIRSAMNGLVLTSSLDRTIGVTDAANGRELTDKVLSLDQPVSSMDVSQNGRYVVGIANNQAEDADSSSFVLQRWDLERPEVETRFEFSSTSVNDLSVDGNASTAYLTCTDNSLKRLDLADGELTTLIGGNQHGGLMWTSVLSRDGRRILTVGGVDSRLWELATGEERMSFGPHGAVAATDINPTGEVVVTGSWDHSLKFWDVASGKTIRKISQAHDGYINSVAYSHDGQFIVTGGDDGYARLWDARTGAELKQYAGNSGDIKRVIFSPDDKLILTASSDRTLRLWDRETGEEQGDPFRGHRWAVLSADFSSDGSRLVSCSEDNRAILWDVATREPIVELSGHTAAVTSVCFSPDDQRVMTASRDNTAKLWDVSAGHEGNEILTLKRHTQEVTAVDFSADELQALTASRDGSAILWPAVDWRGEQVADQPGQPADAN
ncbi:protein kinase [bacterium]|nr:protein kinase [bacterium]